MASLCMLVANSIKLFFLDCAFASIQCWCSTISLHVLATSIIKSFLDLWEKLYFVLVPSSAATLCISVPYEVSHAIFVFASDSMEPHLSFIAPQRMTTRLLLKLQLAH